MTDHINTIIAVIGAVITILVGAITYLLKDERDANKLERASQGEFKTSVLEKIADFEVSQTKLSGSIDSLSTNIESSGDKQDERIGTINKRLDRHDDDSRDAKDNFDELHTRVWAIEMQAEKKGWKVGGKGKK